ncbi:AMP-binding protein [Burkholderia gladioli]|uniref:AMP-binding protein n=1 Tax=Burkholderia gladioli TaxID=28095 RepID=UPI00265097AF|nr:AMP-binding protein [Burkholderia gladioli]MDN7602234.1 AMP-binding protein [Burkholderia gladioli]
MNSSTCLCGAKGVAQTDRNVLAHVTVYAEPADLRPGAVGRAAPGVEIVLLAARGNPADLYGEIAIRSERVALGYWNRPDLTAERFLPDPAGNGARLYRTGDLARWRDGGALDYLGRVDLQLKVRDFRIEPA